MSLVCGSASYRKFAGDCWAELEAGGTSGVAGLDVTIRIETFETEITRRDNPFGRAYLTIIEGCDKACAYCVVPHTRGPERSRGSESILREVRQLAELLIFRSAIAGADGEFVCGIRLREGLKFFGSVAGEVALGGGDSAG